MLLVMWKCILLLFIATQSFAFDGQPIGILGFNPSLPVTGEGPLFNLSQGDQAVTNALCHIGWSVAIPLIGEKLGGKKGKFIAGLSWIALTLAQESFFHAPKQYSSNYPSEVRTDLVTRIVPTLLVLAW